MHADKFACVEHQTRGGSLNVRRCVERIAQDGISTLGHMNSQLMRSACVRREFHSAGIRWRIEA